MFSWRFDNEKHAGLGIPHRGAGNLWRGKIKAGNFLKTGKWNTPRKNHAWCTIAKTLKNSNALNMWYHSWLPSNVGMEKMFGENEKRENCTFICCGEITHSHTHHIYTHTHIHNDTHTHTHIHTDRLQKPVLKTF